MANIADRFAQIEAEYNAIKKLYEATKAEALEACMEACSTEDTKSEISGDLFTLHFSLTSTNSFSAELAKQFLTEEQIAACMTTGTRRNLKAKAKAKITVVA